MFSQDFVRSLDELVDSCRCSLRFIRSIGSSGNDKLQPFLSRISVSNMPRQFLTSQYENRPVFDCWLEDGPDSRRTLDLDLANRLCKFRYSFADSACTSVLDAEVVIDSCEVDAERDIVRSDVDARP